MILSGKTIGELALSTGITSNSLFAIEQSGFTFHIPFSSFSGSNIEDITYSNLYSKVVNGELIPGRWYRLTDYKSVNFLNGWEIANNNPTPIDPNFNPRQIYTGDTEVLILQATSPFEISEVGYSETFYGDIVQYEPFTNKIGVDFNIQNGNTLPDSSTVTGFDLQWDGANVYFNMPEGYPALFGHYFYLYCQFTQENTIGPVNNFTATGTSTGGSTFYTNPTITTLTGIGSGLQIGGVQAGENNGDPYIYSFIIDDKGIDYAVGDQLVIYGSELGGVDGVNDLYITVTFIDTNPTTYYQDGTFEPLTPNISICQFPNTSDDPDYGYPKKISRLKVEEDGYKVILLDLTQNDYLNYDSDTLQVGTVYEIGDAYGWVTRRQDTFRNIDVPFDFRGRKYRRFEVDLSPINPNLGTGYWGQGDDYFGQGTTGNYKDFKVFGSDGYDTYNIKWSDMGGPDMNYYRGYNDNFVALGYFYLNTVGFSCRNNTVGNNFNNNTVGNGFYSNTIGVNFNTNTIGISFYSNTIGDNFYQNTIGINFQSNTIGVNFNNNTIGINFQSNTIGDNFYQNTIGNDFNTNTIGNNFNNNNIGTNFYQNTIGNNFYQNTIGDSFYQNSIGDNFNTNTIGTVFNTNAIGNDFNNNNIGANFQSNTIGVNSFQFNDIKISVTSTNFTSATHVYGNYNCTIFSNSASSLRLSYYDSSDVLNITNITA